MKSKTSIVVLNYNGKVFLRGFFNSLFTGKLLPLEVILVDNNSNDGSLEFVREKYPQVKILKMLENFGFAKAVNKGIVVSRGKYVALLNNDIEVEKNWLYELEKSAEKEEAGFFASKMKWLKDKNYIDNTGIVYNWKGKAYDRGKGEKDIGQYDKFEYVFGACNGASFYKRKLFIEHDLLDENFFLICDDVDMSFRLQLAGIKCLYVPTAVVYHAGGGTVGRWTDTKAKYSARHHIYIILKNFPTKFILINFPFIMIERLRNLSGLAKSVNFKRLPLLLIETYWEVVRKFPEVLRKRHKIQTKRIVSDQYLSSLISRADFASD